MCDPGRVSELLHKVLGVRLNGLRDISYQKAKFYWWSLHSLINLFLFSF